MEELDFTQVKKLKVLTEGGEYFLRRPNLGEAEDLQDELSKAGEAKSIPVIVKWLDRLGLPEEETYKLDGDHLGILIDALIPKKKG